MESRAARSDEVDAVTGTIARAFADDPIWEPALRRSDGGTAHHAPYWRLFVEGALRYGTLRTTPGGEAVAVWLPPGGIELTDAGTAALEALVAKALDDAGRMRCTSCSTASRRAGRRIPSTTT